MNSYKINKLCIIASTCIIFFLYLFPIEIFEMRGIIPFGNVTMIAIRGKFLFMIEPFIFMLLRDWIHTRKLINHTLIYIIILLYIPLLYGTMYLYKIQIEYIYFLYIIPAILLMICRVLILGLWFEMFCNSIKAKDSIKILSIAGITASICKYAAFKLFYNQLSLTNYTNYFLYINTASIIAIISSIFIWFIKPISKQVGLQTRFKFKRISLRNLFVIINMLLLPIMQDSFNTLSQYHNIIKKEELFIFIFLVLIFLFCSILLNSETVHLLSILITSFSIINITLGSFVWLSTILIIIDFFYIYILLHKWYILNANYCMIYCIYLYAISEVLKGVELFQFNKFISVLLFSISTIMVSFIDMRKNQYI